MPDGEAEAGRQPNMSEVRGFRTALFLDKNVRRLATSQPQSWRSNVSRPTYWAKSVLLWLTLLLVEPLSARGALVWGADLSFSTTIDACSSTAKS